jgi:hypothetical protein
MSHGSVRQRRSALTGVVTALVAAVAIAAAAEKWDPTPITASRVLERYETKVELSIFVGAEPSSCTPIFVETEICTWTISNGEAGWKALADAIRTEHSLHLVCEVPTGAHSREPDSCSVHPQRSNRADWRPPFRSERMERTRRKRAENQKAAEERQRQAAALLDSARTVMDLSRLVGKGPKACSMPKGSLRWQCVWHADLATEGHGTLATLAGAAYDDEIRLECFLPADRSPRSIESCSVSSAG